MGRLSHWRVAAWVALCLSAVAVVAALLLPPVFRSHPKHTARVVQATLTPRTHLFGQPVEATLEVPAGSSIRARFTPYLVVRRTIVRKSSTVRYAFTLQCLRSACVGLPGTEHELPLPAVHIRLPNGKPFVGSWPPLRVASRLGPADLAQPVTRGNAIVPDHGPAARALGIGLAAGAALALLAAGLLGALWLAPRPFGGPAGRNGHAELSDLDYALVVTGLAAGGGPDDRRAALESLAVALDERGQGDLAAEARQIAWSPLEPRGDALRRLAATVQELIRKGA